jgi:hypothetical protein
MSYASRENSHFWHELRNFNPFSITITQNATTSRMLIHIYRTIDLKSMVVWVFLCKAWKKKGFEHAY